MAWYDIEGKKVPDAVPFADEQGRRGWSFSPAEDAERRKTEGCTCGHDPRPEIEAAG